MAGRIKRIHVNQHNIRWNTKNPSEPPKPVITMKCGGKTYVGHHVEILGPSEVVSKIECPLSCGARVWIETRSVVKIDDQEIN